MPAGFKNILLLFFAEKTFSLKHNPYRKITWKHFNFSSNKATNCAIYGLGMFFYLHTRSDECLPGTKQISNYRVTARKMLPIAVWGWEPFLTFVRIWSSENFWGYEIFANYNFPGVENNYSFFKWGRETFLPVKWKSIRPGIQAIKCTPPLGTSLVTVPNP